eukprot:CAMPEP_0183298302 /NCGR_PEP_ID=MMETSP0160_2-20130417/5365_1 /TAXON_ID=2839 ORGANISM="Odontella Sinensis, Strain Grunow 1884" /NCGR_SAMPLE_ID=MMETSP0160_2 /ASSEMBLY_ACC=CAM_ASM_000250 /LENGTH=134 /DNA_ID=CAMNT_0025460311 /DNA_START=68 /DNA_END=472 /DNA_ORIENTATION=-
MGKGSNVQKAQAARERNAKKEGKSVEERKAARDKASKDASAFMCLLCRQTFMVNARMPVLYTHVISKHEAGTDPASCFPQLKDFDPNDPKGEKKTTTASSKPAAVKKKKKNDADLSELLDAGLSMGKGKKKGFK